MKADPVVQSLAKKIIKLNYLSKFCWSSLVAQQGKDPVLSLLFLGHCCGEGSISGRETPGAMSVDKKKKKKKKKFLPLSKKCPVKKS